MLIKIVCRREVIYIPFTICYERRIQLSHSSIQFLCCPLIHCLQCSLDEKAGSLLWQEGNRNSSCMLYFADSLNRENVQTLIQICTILFCLLEEEEYFPKLS